MKNSNAITDNTELKRLAESLPQLPWSYEANGFILAWDGTERSRCENVGGFYYVCEGVSNFREYLLALEPAKVLALIAENEQLVKTADCWDRLNVQNKALSDSFRAERDQLKSENDRLLKLLDRTVDQYVPLTELEGVPGWSRVVELVEFVAERDQLKAENERLIESLREAREDRNKLGDRYDAANAEIAGLKTGYEAYERVNAELKAEVGALRKLAPSKEIIWCACGDGHAANSYGAGFMDANGGVCANCDAAMGNGGRGGQSTSKTSESAYPEGLKGGGQ